MVDVLESLIDKFDNFEVIGYQIAAILALETSNQQALATAGGKNPELWKFNVYRERSRPWEALISSADAEGEIRDETPIVNVWYDSATFPKNKGDVVNRQNSEASYNIDVIAGAISKELAGGGYDSGDEQAALNCQRVIRLVRNILMASINTYLQLRGIVWQRWIGSITEFQPQQNDRHIENIIAIRLVLNVSFNEFSPEKSGEILESIFVDLKRGEDDFLFAQLEYNTIP